MSERRAAIEALLERVKAAPGPDRDLDAAIYKKIVGLRQYESVHTRPDGDLCLRYYSDPTGPSYHALPRYTASLAVLAELLSALIAKGEA